MVLSTSRTKPTPTPGLFKSALSILKEIIDKADLNKPGVGVGFVLDVERTIGLYDNND